MTLPPPSILTPRSPRVVDARPKKGPTQQALDALETRRGDLDHEGRIQEAIRIRTERALEANPAKLRLFQREGVTFKVLDGPKPSTDEAGNAFLEVTVHAEKNGETLPLDNPYLWHAPHIEVHDGTFIEEPLLDNDGEPRVDENGKPVTIFVPNYVEDPETALKDQIAETVLHVARSRGWSG